MSEITEAYSYGVALKPEGKMKLLKVLLIILYIIFPVGMIGAAAAVGGMFAILGCLLALADAILIFFTWRYVSLDYEYDIVSGKVTFRIVKNAFNIRLPKVQMEFMLKECVAIAPYKNEQYPECMKKYDEFGVEKVYNALSCSTASDAYFALYTDATGKKCAFLFQATSDTLKRCKWYNKENTVVAQTRI